MESMKVRGPGGYCKKHIGHHTKRIKRMTSFHIWAALCIFSCISLHLNALVVVNLRNSRRLLSRLRGAAKATLTEDTCWRLDLSLEKKTYKSVQISVNIKFIETRNYEPPQGRVFVQDDIQGFTNNDADDFSGKWTLSEDKNERKDGLWIWGLFEEPKYPYLYFTLDVYSSVILPSGEEDKIFGEEGIPGNKLYLRFNHFRDPEKGVVLTNGQVNYRTRELVSADPLGLGGQVDVGEEISVGRVSINPLFLQQ